MGSLGWQYWLVGLLVQLAGARADLDAIYIRTMSRPGAYGLLKTHSSQGSAPLVALAVRYPSMSAHLRCRHLAWLGNAVVTYPTRLLHSEAVDGRGIGNFRHLSLEAYHQPAEIDRVVVLVVHADAAQSAV